MVAAPAGSISIVDNDININDLRPVRTLHHNQDFVRPSPLGGFMSEFSRSTMTGLMAVLLTVAASPLWSAGQDHVASTSQIQQTIRQTAKVREQNLQTVRNFLASPAAQNALKKSKLDYTKIERAVPTLSDQEIAQLAERARTAQKNLAAGALTNEQLTYIVIAIATAVIVILIVEA
jgi:hypothetical protein